MQLWKKDEGGGSEKASSGWKKFRLLRGELREEKGEGGGGKRGGK